MNILITGSEGFVGKALVKKLKQDKNNRVIGLDRGNVFSKNIEYNPDFHTQGDLNDIELIKEIIVRHQINEVYHFAAESIVGICSNDPYKTFKTNVLGTVSLLETCKNYGGGNIESIVISTSDKAYGKAKVPYNEESNLEPLFTYDTSKACQQLTGLHFHRQYGLPIKIVTCSNLYGPGDFNMSRVIPKTITRLSKGESAFLWEDSEKHIREFVYIDDALDAFNLVSKKGKPGEIYCCGGTEHLTIKDLMEKICILMKKDPDTNIKVHGRPVSLMEIQEQYQDSTKLQKLGWIPKVSLEEGLRRSIEFYSKF
ncbi:MAG: GDP-mannose 4,6-dehydratase [Candidatus Pacearchaeota archaeon]|jgi:CDP-glucose 4,6-dehydratase